MNDETKNRWWPESPNRRDFLRGATVAGVGIAAVGLVGCGGDDKNTGGAAGTSSPAAQAPEVPTKGGTLTLGKISDINFSSGYPFYAAAENGYLQDILVESLVRYGKSLDPELWLLERFEYNTDRSKLTATIKQGVTFHNGAVLTPDDVFFGVQLMQNPAKYNVTGTIQLAPFAKFITAMKKVDERTMEFTFDKPRPNMNDFFAQMRITQASSYTKLQKGEDVQGTGPYAFKSWRPNQSFGFVANKNWHGTATQGGPYLDAIDVTLFADQDALGLAYEAGSLDVIGGAPRPVAKKYRNLTKVAPKGGLTYCGVNVTNPLLKDARVRQALMYAIDRKRLVDEIGEGFGTVTNQPWPDTSPAFDKTLDAPFFDPAKAKALLQQAGFSSSRALQIEHRITNANEGAVLKENFEAIGLKIELIQTEANAFAAKLRAKEFKDFWITTHSFSDLTPLTNFQQTIPYQAANPSYYQSADYSDLQAKLEALDPVSPAAKEQYARFNKLWIEDPWVLALEPNSRVDLFSAKVRGNDEYLGAPGSSANWGRIWKKA